MNPEIEKLLAVLDMPEYEQFEFLCNHEIIDKDDYESVISAVTQEQRDFLINRCLADLAFRLRDKVVKLKYNNYEDTEGYGWHYALRKVYKHITNKRNVDGIDRWIKEKIRPIDMIISALIAGGKDAK